MLTVRMPDSHGFGRIVRSTDGKVSHIVEEAQASQKELTIQELNVGAYCIRAEWLWRSLQKIKVSPKGEYYLTDIVQVSVEDGFTVRTIELEDPLEATGINNRVHLAEAETILRRRINTAWMEAGVTLVDPDCTYIEPEVMIASDTTIFPNSHLRGKTSIGPGCQIGPNSIVVDSSVGAKCAIISSMVEGAVIENGVSIGPFSHLRKGAHLHDDVHIGNFGEVKDSVLGPGTKMGHFSYIGNATIGKNVNIGAGTITCNYDGNEKHPTVIGDNVFIGSDSMLVAPVNIGDGARTGAGAVVTHDVQPGEIVVGVPAHPLRNKDKDE
jgi:bifunctional UDP-N-acetylglucosamine pyrophosphorylase/glucosamine-1-phosphate N-acetyltransferase